MIRPTAGVRVPPSGSMGHQPMMGQNMGQQQQQPMMGQQNPQTPGEMIKAMLTNNMTAINSNQGGGFNWGQYSTTLYEDDALRSLKSGTEHDENSNAYFIERVASAMAEFMKQIFHRVGPFFEEYKKARDSFPMTGMGTACPARMAFIEAVNKQPEFTRIMAITGTPFFGKRLIEVLRQDNRDQLKTSEYLDAVHIAVRNVLFFELINWLMKTPQGQQHARQLSPDLLSKFANLERFKDVAQATFDTFGQSSPYASVEFKRPESTRPDWSALYGQYSDMFQHQQFGGTNGNADTQMPVSGDPRMVELMEMVRRNAAEYRGESRPQSQPQQNSYGDAIVNWNTVRNDMNNLTPLNRNEFSLKRFFHSIGKPNHYFIPESDWKTIQHAFRKHAEQGPEETVQPGSFRIVNIDIDGDSGWFSRVVRSEALDMPTVLSDPSKLLPLIEDPENLAETYKVTPVKHEDVAGKTTMAVIVANVKKLKDIPLIQFGETIVGNNSTQLSNTIDTANAEITRNIHTENATAFSVAPWDVFTVGKPEDKTRLYNDMPFLFRDNDATEGPTPYQAARALRTYFAQGIINADLANFIDSVLTTTVNDWLVNVQGYTVAKGKGTHLSIGSYVADMEDLSTFLKENNEDAHRALHVNDENTHLVSRLQIFNFSNPYAAKEEEGKEVSALNRLQLDLDLTVIRPMYVAVVNHRGGPLHQSDEPVVMRRSQYPEYFQLVESGFEDTMGETVPYDTTDKLIRFSSSNNTWLFSYSAFDPNVATLRHVSNTKPLVLLPLD